jgi:hypothetical protein
VLGQANAPDALRVRGRNEPLSVYPNHQAPVVVEQDGQRVVREDMRWGFPPFQPGAGYGTNFRSLKIKLWRDWLDREHRRRGAGASAAGGAVESASPRRRERAFQAWLRQRGRQELFDPQTVVRL